MNREALADLVVVAAVAEEGSFTRAANRLAMSQSALSQIVQRVEARLGLRLFARTTRSLAPTAAGERLLATLSPTLRELEASIVSLGELRDRPAGKVRITTVEHAARKFLVPKLAGLLQTHPDIQVEVAIDYGLTDIVSARFDAGVRLGEQVEKDMIAAQISPPVEMAIVGAPDYFARHAAPVHPRELSHHPCINLRMPSSGTHYEWKLGKRGKRIHVRLDGPMVFNALDPIVGAALAGIGLANIPLDVVAPDLASGRLLRVLADWSLDLPPYYLYYPHRRPASGAFKLVVEQLMASRSG